MALQFSLGEEVCNVVIKVTKAQVPYITSKPIHFTQETEDPFDDGSILVKLKLINNYELRSVLLSYGADIEILEPESLREQMKLVFQTGNLRYK